MDSTSVADDISVNGLHRSVVLFQGWVIKSHNRCGLRGRLVSIRTAPPSTTPRLRPEALVASLNLMSTSAEAQVLA
jgi:hypothetical protein